MEVISFLKKHTELDFSDVIISPEGTEYYAASFKVSRRQYIFRSAKVTPKKIGLFVTLWCRNKVASLGLLTFLMLYRTSLFILIVRINLAILTFL